MYPYSKFGVRFVPRPGCHSLMSRPIASYAAVVVLLLASTTVNALPQAGSRVVVVVWPCGLVITVDVNGPPLAGM